VLTTEGEDIFQAYRMLREYNAWPRPGGWMRQTALFVEAVDLCDGARGLYRARLAEREAEAKRLAALMAGMGR
jgi:hypothetical protein